MLTSNPSLIDYSEFSDSTRGENSRQVCSNQPASIDIDSCVCPVSQHLSATVDYTWPVRN